VAAELLAAADAPIAAPSANRSSMLSPTRAEHLVRDLSRRIDLVLDGGPTSGGLESTVVDLSVDPPRLLRPGLVDPRQIEAVVGPIERTATAEAGGLPSPGMLPRHYAPRAILECAGENVRERVSELLGRGSRVGWLVFEPPGLPENANLQVVVMPTQA